MATLSVEYKAVCSECGDDLYLEDESNRYGEHTLKFSPCPACIQSAVDKALEEANE